MAGVYGTEGSGVLSAEACADSIIIDISQFIPNQ